MRYLAVTSIDAPEQVAGALATAHKLGAIAIDVQLGDYDMAPVASDILDRMTARGQVMPPDLGGTATTAQVTDAVIAAIHGANA